MDSMCDRYHKLSTNNPTFKSLVSPLAGYEDVLLAAGFERRGPTSFEWVWGALPDVGCHPGRGPSQISTGSDAGRVSLQPSPSSSSFREKSLLSGVIKEDMRGTSTETTSVDIEGSPGVCVGEVKVESSDCVDEINGHTQQPSNEAIVPRDLGTAVSILKSEIKMMQCLLDVYGEEERSAARGGKTENDPSVESSSRCSRNSRLWIEKIEKIMQEEVSQL